MNRAYDAFGIVNPYGSFWCNETFESEADAREFFKKHLPEDDGRRFSIIPVVVTFYPQIEKPATFRESIPMVKEPK